MPSKVERKNLKNGKPNPKYVDLLEEDKPIAGQKFMCVSFISPEEVLKKRELYIFEKFVQNWSLSKSMEKFGEFINFLSYKYNLNPQNVIADFNDFVKEEEPKLKASSAILDDYKNFVDKNEETLNQIFNKENGFQTSVRGMKARGNFATQEEAEMHCKKLREADPNFDIYVAPVGVWVPVDINAYKTGRVEHLEPELNRLFEEKIKNEAVAKEEFDERVKASKKKAIEENIKLASVSGNKLTQTIDPEGNLVGVNTMDFDGREVANDEERKEHEKQVYLNSNPPTLPAPVVTNTEPEPDTNAEPTAENP
jgi:hypothetical protein